MNETEPFATALEAKLRARGLSRVGAFVLEALEPLAPIGAQLAFLLEPMAASQPNGWLSQFGALLERPAELADLTERLRQDGE